MKNFPQNKEQLAKQGEPALSNQFLYLNHITRDEMLWFYWYSVAKPAILKNGSFDAKSFNALYLKCLCKYECGFDEPSIDEKYMALKEARDLWEAPKKEEPKGFSGLLRDCFHPDSIWG